MWNQGGKIKQECPILSLMEKKLRTHLKKVYVSKLVYNVCLGIKLHNKCKTKLIW